MKNEENHPDTIDTTGMSEDKRQALEVAESARKVLKTDESFCAGLFMGKFNMPLIQPYPEQSLEDQQKGGDFLFKLEELLRTEVDPDSIDNSGEIPDHVLEQLASLGAFGIKVPQEYGGLGLSQTTYCNAAMLLGSWCGNLTALLSAHQSIGVPQPLLLFGTEEQKKKWLPRVAKGEISAFALTEDRVGSDPARMETTAERSGEDWVLNGKKLWCTNGTRAGVIVVMARTPDKEIKGRSRRQITAFIIDMNTPGVTIETRCRFMGLRSLYNAVIRFDDVRVPSENIIGGEGNGLKVALSTLNTGRLTIPAACAGLNKRCIKVCREWASEREQWGAPIGKHAAIADKIGRMTADAYATEAITWYTAQLVDRKQGDIRLEAAVCKMLGTEYAYRIVDDTLQIRGGRGFETEQTQHERGEKTVPVERWLRDSRINLIFEGSSEIMRLFIAREALDTHLRIGGKVMNSTLSKGKRIQAGLKALGFYASWYPRMYVPTRINTGKMDRELATEVQWASRRTKRLAKSLFHAMVKYGPKLEREQMVLKQIVDIGAEIFTLSIVLCRADAAIQNEKHGEEQKKLALTYAALAKQRIDERFIRLKKNANKPLYSLAQKVLNKSYTWYEKGIVVDD